MTIIKKINMDVTGMTFDQSHWPIVHTSMIPNLVTKFYGTDTKEDYINNLNRLGNQWIYANKEITYKFNSNGLRMDKELTQVDDQYIAAFGCSHTVGVGVQLEDSWPYLLSKELGLDYINSGVSGASVKLTAINFFNMINTIKQLPSIVAIAWPSDVRYCFYVEDQFVFYLPRFISSDKTLKDYAAIYNNMLITDVLTTEAIFYRNMVKSCCKRLGIKYAEVCFDNRDQMSATLNIPIVYVHETLKDVNLHHARDVRGTSNGAFISHPGSELHRLAVQELIKQL